MAVKRQDAWTIDDDRILAEITLRHIREGGTQLSSFEEVAHHLGRTPAACGFRWNSTVRKKYESEIQLAKKQRQKRGEVTSPSYQKVETVDLGDSSSLTYSLDNIIRYLRQHKNELNEMKRIQKQLEKELAERQLQLHRLEHENNEMKKQLSHMQSDYHLVDDDYRTLMQIMERARKMTFMDENQDASVNKNRLKKQEEINPLDP